MKKKREIELNRENERLQNRYNGFSLRNTVGDFVKNHEKIKMAKKLIEAIKFSIFPAYFSSILKSQKHSLC